MTAPLTRLQVNSGNRPAGFVARRIVMLAGAAAVGACVMLVGADTTSNRFTSAAYAQTVQPRSGFADIVDKIKPAVISVRAKLDPGTRTTGRGALPSPEENPLERFFRQFGLPDNDSAPLMPRSPLTKAGSGFFISADGYAVTNNHVVEGVSSVEVTTDNGKVYTAKVVGADDRTDVALIKVDGRSDFPFAKFAERVPRVGDWVLAVGNPFGLGGTSRPASCRRGGATSALGPMTTSSRSTLR